MDELVLLSKIDKEFDLYEYEHFSFLNFKEFKECDEVENAKRLLNDINRTVSRWDGFSKFTFKNINDLSIPNLDELKLYANYYIKNNGKSFHPLKSPSGSIKSILDDYDVKVKYSGFYW